MWHNFYPWFIQEWAWVVPVILATLLAVFSVYAKHFLNFQWTDFFIMLPFIGDMHRWKQETSALKRKDWDVIGGSLAMPKPEHSLCSKYKSAITPTSYVSFKNAKEFLRLAKQTGRSPTSKAMWIILFALTVAEAVGTGMVIAPFVAQEMTGNEMIYVGYVIAFAMAYILMRMTHKAGEETYRRNTISVVLGRADRNQDFFDYIDAEGATHPGETIVHGAHQEQDENVRDDRYRFARRVLRGRHDRGEYTFTVWTLVLVVALLSGIAWVRVKGMEANLTQAASETNGSGQSGNNPFANLPGMGGAATLPAAVSHASHQADQHVQQELTAEKRSQGYGGVFVLSLIYLLTQFLGFTQGYTKSFVNGESEEAHELTRGYSDYNEYWNHCVGPYVHVADMRLKKLRSYFAEVSPEYREAACQVTFLDYLKAVLAQESDYLRNQETQSEAVPYPAAEASAEVSAEPTPSVGPATSSPGVVNSDPRRQERVSDENVDFSLIASRILDAPNLIRRKEVYAQLTEGFTAAQLESVKAAMQTLKEQRKAEAAQADAELNSLLSDD